MSSEQGSPPAPELTAERGWLADDEQFCSRCAAGVASSEHHFKCVVLGFAEDGESANLPRAIIEPVQGSPSRVARSGRPLVYRHSCERDGTGDGPCEPACDDPWVAEVPGPGSDAFATLPEAYEHAARWSQSRIESSGGND